MKINKRFENDSQALLNIATTFADAGDHPKAVEHFDKAVTLTPQSPEINFAYGSYLLEHILQDRKRKFSLSVQGIGELKKSETLLSAAIELLRESDKKKELRDALVNRSTARIILDRFTEAEEDLNFAIGLKDNSPLIYANRGRLFRIRNRIDEAILDFKKALTVGAKKDDIFPMLASCYLEREDVKVDEFIELLKEHYKDEETVFSETLHAESLILKKDLDAAEHLIKKAYKHFGRAPRILATEASLQKARGNTKAVEALLKEAAKGNGLDENMAKLELAVFYKRSKKYDDAIPLFEQLASAELFDQVLMDYLTCLYNSKQNRRENINKCLEICKNLRQKGQENVGLLELEASIYQSLDHLKEASELFYELTKIETKQYRHKLNYATTLIEMGGEKLNEGKKLLYEIKDGIVDKQYLVLLGKFFARVGDYEEAIKTLYKALELDYRDSETQLIYMYTFLNRGEKKTPLLDSDIIVDDFYIRIKRNGREETFFISSDPKANYSKHEIYKDSGLGKQLFGKQKGEIIKIKTNDIEDIYEVLEIKSKYVRAFQEILDNFNKDFPDDKTLQMVKADPAEIANRLRLMSERQEQIVEMYKAKQLPINLLSNLLNRDIFVTWVGLVTQKGLRLYCASGSVEEQRNEQDLVENSDTVVIDLISLLTLSVLELLDLPQKVFKNVYVQRATVDEIEAQLLEARGRQKEGFMTLFHLEGKTYRDEVKPEQAQKRLEYLEKLRAAVQKMTIMGLDSPLEDSLTEKEKVYGRSYIHLIQLCLDRKIPLFSDDFLLRGLLFNEYKIRGFSIQNFMVIAGKKGLLSEMEYCDKIIELSKRNYHYLSVSAQMLFHAVEKNHFQPRNADFDALIETLAEDTTIESLITVLSDFIRLIYIDKLPPDVKARYLDVILNRLSAGGNPEHIKLFLKALQNKLQFVEFLMPQIQKEIQRWLKSRGALIRV